MDGLILPSFQMMLNGASLDISKKFQLPGTNCFRRIPTAYF